ncbi:MAG: 50S ribosomal protein L18 [Propionibacteriaceae bacterium]|jgi:large subunit ribosomal protein L18|uniref:Large ribosomal subunit protein uL18 n=1 Tax=Propionibacterium ruminifibrarum TaxID=1962131 RepID=A0A375I1P2_9ACTN|nr:50S ribosomal protein L18 [Propionibacterium ruminifibrarum]MBE6478146.1 50S ribosomal protein L18 [Propionibacteriaceae bacterium]SPF68732.1 L18_bact: ribosomal protein uL18 [Propionibacterium ruminifibrarum]
MAVNIKHQKHLAARRSSQLRRQKRGRKKIFGYPERPRLVVTRSARHMVAQVIDDVAGVTLVSASTMEQDVRALDGDKTAKAARVGELVGQRAKDAGIEQVVFDRAGNQYHGRVAAVADGARKAGLSL